MASNGCAGSSPARGTFLLHMKKFAYFFILIASLTLTACGVSSNRFQLEGRFLHMDQGEFYVYSPDGGIEGVDTIKVIDGRFTYEAPCKDKFTLMIVFPNFSEQPVFAEPGKSVDIKADASHLKELTVKGSKDNELMNSFREQILNVSPPEETRIAERFIKDNPASVVSVFLVRKYFVAALSPDYAKASQLLSILSKEQPGNGNLARLTQQIKWLKSAGIGSQLPVFTAYDTNGKLISSTSLASAPVAVITTWSSSVFDSMDLLRELKKRQRSSQGKLKLMSICIDGNKADCKRNLERDSISWPNVCNGDLLADKTLLKLGLIGIPDNIVLKNGKIVARSLKKNELNSKLDQLLK